MMFKTGTTAIVVLAVATGLAQSASPVAAAVGASSISHQQSLAGRSGTSSLAGNKTAGVPTQATLRERVHDMEGTLAKMHAVLKQMRAKEASSSKDPLAKANLDMWELLVGHLDKELRELQVAMITREDMEARRADMYKQAEAKADAAAQAARASSAAQAAGAGQSAAGQPAAGQPSTAPPTTSSPSPN